MKEEPEFKKMGEYFSSELAEKDVLLKDDKGAKYIDMSWIFTEAIDRRIIQKAIANVMKRNNPQYEEKCRVLGRKPEQIEQLEIRPKEERTILQAKGADGWTKLNITDRFTEKDNKGIGTITTEQLEQEILETLNSQTIEGIISEMNLTEEQKEKMYSLFKEKGAESFTTTLMGIKSGLNQAWGNLVDYYKYLVQTKREHETHKCTIKQRQDNTGSKQYKRRESST